ncbi:thioredoxin [Alkaliphilus pronyensis]|uniref:Thioredoxin n=1 Tax=Alkaliphilus pronyensis TaxID=1482732 RepID=A0A6I0EX62_9FIRM|nr:thioredoxin domain-containing protein [Alkaliphilus pronyensis]KAB3532918.1 thioredoxin [Alkaliphilus pronyensis]
MIAVDKETFEAEVLNADGYVLVDFWSDGCEPCKALMPDVEELEKQFGNQIKFVKLNTTQARRLAIKEKVLGLPTISIYKDGNKIDEVTKEEATRDNIEAMIKKHV